MKKGLVLEGGAMRGMFTCGVLDVLMEENIEFDGMSGISAGAVFGCNYKSKQIGRGIRYNKKYGKDKRYFGLKSLIDTGDIYNTNFCYNEILENLDPLDKKTFKENKMEFFVGATDIENAKIKYKNCLEISETTKDWIRASSSMPLVSNIVEVEGYKLLDGGIVDPIPYKILEENGYDKNVLVLTQPRDFVKKKTNIIPLLKLRMPKYKKLIEAIKVRHEVYNNQTSEIIKKENEKQIFVIRPEQSLNIKRTENDPIELERVYQIGREVMIKKLSELKKFLNG